MNQTYVHDEAYEWEGLYAYKEAKFPSHPWGAYHKFSISQLINRNYVPLIHS
jgi:hypothetical protein